MNFDTTPYIPEDIVLASEFEIRNSPFDFNFRLNSFDTALMNLSLVSSMLLS